MSIGKIIENKRDQLGLTIEDVRYKTRISATTISNLEAWKPGYNPRLKTVMTICKFLGIEPGFLLAEYDDADVKKLKVA